jgi:EmrB/QacA subfamily drug resistance transporter
MILPDGGKEKGYVLLMASLSAFFTPFMASSINVALPSISDEFSLTAFMYGWVATSYLLAAAMLLVPFGRLADIHGRKRVFLMGIWIFTFSSILCAFAPSAETLIVFRVLQGTGSAMMFSTMTAIVVSVYPPNERGKAIGITTAMVYIGLSAGPFLGGVLTDALGWRSLFLVLLPMSVPILYIGHRMLRAEWAEARGEPFDKTGSAIYALALSGVIIGFSLLPQTIGLILAVAGSAGVALFVWQELRTKSPVLDMRLFRGNRTFAFSNLAALINYGATFAVGFLLSPYLQVVKGMSPWDAGLLLASQPIVMAIFSPIAGRLSDKVEPRLLATAGMTITTIGLVLFSLLTEDTWIYLIVGNLMFLGFGFALFSSPNTNAIMSSVERRHLGTASASVGTMRIVGQVLSLGIANLCIALFIGNVHIAPAIQGEFLQGLQLAFSIFAAICFFGIFASFARGNVREGSASPQDKNSID